MEEVISSIWIDFKTEPPLNISSESVTNLVSLKRVNYPHNCYTLDLSSVAELRHESIKTIFISFKSGNIEKVQISLKGRTLASNREIYDNTFHTKGDTISATPGRLNKYAVEISKTVYLEEDEGKKCRNYPNSEYASYMECDDRYMRNICAKIQLVPIWLSDDIGQVTTRAVINQSGSRFYNFKNWKIQ